MSRTSSFTYVLGGLPAKNKKQKERLAYHQARIGSLTTPIVAENPPQECRETPTDFSLHRLHKTHQAASVSNGGSVTRGLLLPTRLQITSHGAAPAPTAPRATSFVLKGSVDQDISSGDCCGPHYPKPMPSACTRGNPSSRLDVQQRRVAMPARPSTTCAQLSSIATTTDTIAGTIKMKIHK